MLSICSCTLAGCTVVHVLIVQLYTCTLYSYTHADCTVVHLQAVQLYTYTLYSGTHADRVLALDLEGVHDLKLHHPSSSVATSNQ